MPVSFERMRSFENRRVIMRFDDDHEVIARLLSATEDMDGSHHLIYDNCVALPWTDSYLPVCAVDISGM